MVQLLRVADEVSDGISLPDVLRQRYTVETLDPDSHGVSIVRGLLAYWKSIDQPCRGLTDYRVESMPTGYEVVYTSRESRIDWYQFGHPSGYRFDSWKKFAVHFAHLLRLSDNPESVCECIACKPNTNPAPRKSSKPSTVNMVDTPKRRSDRSEEHMFNHSLIERTNMEERSYTGGYDELRTLLLRAQKAGTLNAQLYDKDDFISARRAAHRRELLEQGNTVIAGLEGRFMPGIDCRLGELVLFQTTSNANSPDSSQWLAGIIVKVPNRVDLQVELISIIAVDDVEHQLCFEVQLVVSEDDFALEAISPPLFSVPAHQLFPFQLYAPILSSQEIDIADWHNSIGAAIRASLTASSGLIIKAFCPSWPDQFLLQHEWIWLGPQRYDIGDAVVIHSNSPGEPCDQLPEGITLVIRLTAIKSELNELEDVLQVSASDRRRLGTHAINGFAYIDAPFRSDDFFTKECTEDEAPIDVDGAWYGLPKSMQEYGGSRQWHAVFRSNGTQLSLEMKNTCVRGRLIHSAVTTAYELSLDIPADTLSDAKHFYQNMLEDAITLVTHDDPQAMLRSADGFAYFESRAEQLGIKTFNREMCTHVAAADNEEEYEQGSEWFHRYGYGPATPEDEAAHSSDERMSPTQPAGDMAT